MDYDKRLDKLCKKYHIYKHRDRFTGYIMTSVKMRKVLRTLFLEFDKVNVALLGTKRTFDSLKRLKCEIPDMCIDYDQEKEFIDRIYKKQIKVVIVALGYNEQQYDALRMLYNSETMRTIEIVDIYNLLEYRGVYCCYDFYFYGHPINNTWDLKKICVAIANHYCGFFSGMVVVLSLFGLDKYVDSRRVFLFDKLFSSKKEFESLHKGTYKKYCNQKLISNLIFIRDFDMAFKYLSEYNNQYNEPDYIAFESLIRSLLNELREDMNSRDPSDIIINWVDAISYDRLFEMPFLCETAKKNIFFKNMFTVMPWTSWTLKSMFSGKLVVKDTLFRYHKIGMYEEEYPLIEMLRKHKYDFFYFGDDSIGKKVFHKCFTVRRKPAYRNVEYLPSTIFHWEAIARMVRKRNKAVVLIHNLYETHPPFFHIGLDKMQRDYRKVDKLQKLSAAAFSDRSIHWFHSLYGKNSVKIYLGDHGDPTMENRVNYADRRSRVFLIVENAGVQEKAYEGMFSLSEFGKMMEKIIDKDFDFTSLEQDYIYLEGYDPYGKEARTMSDKNERIDLWMQYRAIRTSHEKYVRFVNGEERYFILPDENTNLSGEGIYQERIKQLGNILGEDFVDIFKWDFFKNSRGLYQQEDGSL